MDKVVLNQQVLGTKTKEVNINSIGIKNNFNCEQENQLNECNEQKNIVKDESTQVQNIDSHMNDVNNLESNSNKDSSESDNNDDDDSFEFDHEKINQRIAAKQSHLPSWFLETDKLLNNYNNKIKDVQDKIQGLNQGLKTFEEKRTDHEQKVKEERRQYLIKKYQLEDNTEEVKNGFLEQKYKSAFYQINQYILMKILQFVGNDLIHTLLKMSRVSRKFYYLTVNDEVWKNICRDMLGHAFVDLNQNIKDQAMQKQQSVVTQSTQNNTNSKRNSKTEITTQVPLKSQNSKELQKQNSFSAFDQKTYWKNLSQYFYKEFQRFTITLKNYRNQNCPLLIEYSARTDMIKGLKLVNEIFSLVALNKHKTFGIYRKLMVLLKDSFTKGTYCLSRLAQMDEENIKYDAFDALFSLISLEKSELPRFRVFQSISSFLNKVKFTEEKKLKALLSTEIAEIQSMITNTYDRSSIFFTSLIYNQRVLIENSNTFCNYDLNNNQTESQLINSIINSTKQQDFIGFICKRDSNQISEIKGQITFSHEKFEGFGITSDSTNFKINGSIKLLHSQYLKKIYEVYNTVSSFGKGSTNLIINQLAPPKKFNLFASFSYTLADSPEKDIDSKQYLTFYGSSENLREIIVIKL